MMEDKSFNVTNGIASNIFKAVDKSIDKKNKDLLTLIVSYFRSALYLSVKYSSIEQFHEYIFFPSYIYYKTYELSINDSTFTRIHQFISKHSINHLRDLGWFDLSFFGKMAKTVKEKKEFNYFYYWMFYSFNQLFYFTIKNRDFSMFRFTMDEYDQISEGFGSNSYDLKYKIREQKRDNVDGKNNEKISQLNEEYKVNSQFETYRRHVLLSLRYWIYFLYSKKKIKSKGAKQFLSRIIISNSEPEKLINDILFFRSAECFYGYLGWSEWDIKERPSGKSFTPPNPFEWMTLGFMADQIRENRIYLELTDLDSKELSAARFLFDNLKDYSSSFEANFDYWKDILLVEKIDDLKKRSSDILGIFATIKRQTLSVTERKISITPLNQRKITKFREIVGKAWKSQAHIHSLFKKFGNFKDISGEEIKLKIFGRRTFFEKAKMMFIDTEEYQSIYGVDQMGGVVGKWEDDEFINTVIKNSLPFQSGNTLIEVIDKSFIELKRKGIIPSLILISPEQSWSDSEFRKSSRFVSKLNEEGTENEMSFFYIGQFDNVPIFSSFSQLLRNKVIVCNFVEAFQMRYKTDPSWYENELNVKVIEVSDKESEKVLKENPDKWKISEGTALSDDDALVLIKTSVIIDIWTTLDFQVVNKDAFIIGFVKSEGTGEQ